MPDFILYFVAIFICLSLIATCVAGIAQIWEEYNNYHRGWKEFIIYAAVTGLLVLTIMLLVYGTVWRCNFISTNPVIP